MDVRKMERNERKQTYTDRNSFPETRGMSFVQPGMSPKEIVKAVRSLNKVCFTSVGMRDAGQSDFKNRHRIYDLKTLAPHYEQMGLFSAETHGGARWHVGIMNRKESPFE